MPSRGSRNTEGQDLRLQETPGKKRPRCWDDLVSEGSTAGVLSNSITQSTSDCSLSDMDEASFRPPDTTLIDSSGVQQQTPDLQKSNNSIAQCTSPVPQNLESELLFVVPQNVEDSFSSDLPHHQAPAALRECPPAMNSELPWQEELNAANLAARALKRLVELQTERCHLRQQLQVGLSC
jgi:hypothetical protein